MTLYSLKPGFQGLLRPLAGKIARRGGTANQVTLAAGAGSVLLGGVLARWGDARGLFVLLPIWLFLRMAFNAIDGMLAREFGQKSALGAYLNELCDVVSDTALYAPFALVAPFSPQWTLAAVFLAALSEMAGLLGPMVGASRRYDGPLGKSDRALVFGALALWIGLAGSVPAVLAWLMPGVAVLLLMTTTNRVRRGLVEIGGATP